MLTRETFRGPWAGLPVPWTAEDTFAEEVYRRDVARCCRAGVPGIYTAGTTGEFYAMELDEWEVVAQATVEVCRTLGVPCMLGCTSTCTRGAARRAALAARLGADAVQVALPFWMEVPDDQVVPFFRAVAEASGGLPLSVYETTRTRKALTLEQHRALRDAIPQYLMVKANANTLGATPQGCRALSGIVNVFVGEHLWAGLGPCGARGGCSSMVYWNPRVILGIWRELEAGNWKAVEEGCARLRALDAFLGERYEPAGFTDTAYDRMGARAFGFLESSLPNRGPYVSPTQADVEDLRGWCREHFPEMLEL
ncbi:MAG: dihydrodipicolinate synthase family protein [Candidatus Latescibacterota bacterium]